MSGPGLVAVARGEVQGAGAIVWWKISGATEVRALRAAWTVHPELDPDLLMNPPTAGAALRRALGAHAHATTLGRQLVSGLGEENAYAIVEEVADGNDVHHRTILKARLVGPDHDALQVSEYDAAPVGLPARITADFQANLTTYSGQDVSNWFATVILPAVNAVSLREQGGMWFVPRTHLDLWHLAVQAVREASGHVVYEIPAMSTAHDAIAGVLDALAQEAETKARAVEDELLEAETPLGVRALRTRAARLDKVAAKVTSYENMLGVGLERLQARLERLNATIAAAIFTAEALSDPDEIAA